MTVGSGQKWLELLNASGPLGCLARMCLESSVWNSTRCYLTWSVSVTPSRRSLFRLSASMPRTEGNEFGLWATPNAANSVGSTGGGQGRSLRDDVRIWPTPTKAIADGGQSSRSGKRKGELLLTGMAKLWLTPKSSPSGPDYARMNREGSGGDDLATAVNREMWPTPNARDWRSGTGRQENGHSPQLPEVVGGQLNPTWVSVLMGYPPDWTELED